MSNKERQKGGGRIIHRSTRKTQRIFLIKLLIVLGMVVYCLVRIQHLL